MKLTELYADQFRKLQNGEHWLDVDFTGYLKQLTAEQAAKKISGQINSIWVITEHVIFWRNNLVKKLKGESTEGDKDFEPITDLSEENWKNTLKRLEESLNDLTETLLNTDEIKLNERYKNYGTYNEFIIGTLQHDAYHLGQIVLLVRYS